jgi:hypothetical protein
MEKKVLFEPNLKIRKRMIIINKRKNKTTKAFVVAEDRYDPPNYYY